MFFRPLFYTQSVPRSFDWNSLAKDTMLGDAYLTQDFLGQTYSVFSGFTPTATGTLTISFTAGRLYTLQQTDATSVASGILPADPTLIEKQAWGPASSLILTTSALAVGQSQWVLIQATYAQSDSIASLDPGNGLENFYNSTNPLVPYIGPGGDNQTIPTLRTEGVSGPLVPLYGTPATTGSEVPPSSSAGFVPLYLIHLTYGQTSITQGQILTSGPSVGTNVPSNYPYAPLLAGLLNSHHGGTPGQAPQINLATEVQGTLSAANLPPGSLIPLTAPLNLYVNSSTGNDLNSGLSGAPFLTLQRAISYVKSLSLNGYQVMISATSTSSVPFTGGFRLDGGFLDTSTGIATTSTGAPNVILSFTAGSVCNDTGLASGNNAIFNIVNGGNITIEGAGSGVTLTTTNVANYAISVGNYAICYLLGGVNFGSLAGPQAIYVLSAIIALNGSFSISGSVSNFIICQNVGQAFFARNGVAMTITLTGTPNFSSAFVLLNSLSLALFNASVVTISGSATGSRFNVSSNSVLITNGTPNSYLPGSVNGTTATGGQAL